MQSTKWIYQGKVLEDLPEHAYGFVYEITYTTGQKYIGKKNCFAKSTLPALKTGIPRPGSERKGKNKDGKRIYVDIVTKESPWREYEGSSKNTTDLTIAAKEILEFAPTGRSLTYLEAQHLFCKEAIISPNYLNDNILGKFHRGKLL